MNGSHFTPAYALQTMHPYAQYTGDVTYPGPSVLSVGNQQFGAKFWLFIALAAIAGGLAGKFVF